MKVAFAKFETKVTFALFFLLIALNTGVIAQKITLPKMLSVLGSNDVANFDEYLKSSGYKSSGEAAFPAEGETDSKYWDYKTDTLMYFINIAFKRTTNFIEAVRYRLYDRDEYAGILNSLESFGFKKFGKSNYFPNGFIMEAEFKKEGAPKKREVHIIMDIIKLSSFGSSEPSYTYEIEVCFCSRNK